MANFYTLVTNQGLAAFANALAANTTVQFTHLAVGDGNGAAVTPGQSATALVHEVQRVPISSVTEDADNPNWIVIEALLLATVGGWTIREIGLIGGGGKLLAVGNFPDTYKPLLETENASRDMTIRMVIEVSNSAAVTLTLDPSVAVATNQSISNAVAAHKGDPNAHAQYLKTDDLPIATTTQRGIAELATAAETTAGTSDVLIVTPAGLAAAMNLHTGAVDPHPQYINQSELTAALAEVTDRARTYFLSQG